MKKTSIRHPKAIPECIKDSEKVTFQDFINNKTFQMVIVNYEKILKKLYKNSTSKKPITHISKYLEEEEFFDLKMLIYHLASLGFQFTDIHYLFLNTFSPSKPSLWTKEISQLLGEAAFLQIPVQVHLYKDNENDLGELKKEYKEKTDVTYLDEKKHTKRLEKIIEILVTQKIALIHLETKKTLSVNQLLKIMDKKENRKK